MKHLALFVTLGLSLCPAAVSFADTPPRIKVVAAHFAPLQMTVDGKVVGYVTDLARKVIERVKSKVDLDVADVQIQPFRRALNELEAKPNILFFSLSRTSKREKNYLWVGEVSPYEIYFYKLKGNRQVNPRTLEDARIQGHRLGVAAKSNTEGLLKELNFKKGSDYVSYSHYSKGVAMLFKNRFAMMPLTSFVARANVCALGYDGDQIEPVIRVDRLSKPLWMVFSKGTDPALVAQFRKALSELKAENVDREIRERYLEEQDKRPCRAKSG